MIHRGFSRDEGRPLFKLDREVEPEVANALLIASISLSKNMPTPHHLFGCKQISEIAVMPQVQASTTLVAHTAIDMLSVLLSKRLPPRPLTSPLDDEPPLPIPLRTFAELLLPIFGPIRNYMAARMPDYRAWLQGLLKNLLYQPLRLQQRTLCRTCTAQETAGDQQPTADAKLINHLIERE
jgi:hypothetical protein